MLTPNDLCFIVNDNTINSLKPTLFIADFYDYLNNPIAITTTTNNDLHDGSYSYSGAV